MKRALTTNLISFLATTALIFLCASAVTPPQALADAPPSARAPLTYRETMQMRRKIKVARNHLTRIDRLIRDKELDLRVYDHLNPMVMENEDQSFEYDVKETHAQLKKLRARRKELAGAIVAASARYNIGFTDLQPARGYASEAASN
jgi:hypothetical protein